MKALWQDVVVALMLLGSSGCGLKPAGAQQAFGDIVLSGDLRHLSRETAFALTAAIPLRSAANAGGQAAAEIRVRSENVQAQSLAWGGGARLAESLLSLTLNYEVLRLGGDGAAPAEPLHASCRRSVEHPLNETRPLATERQRAALVAALATACAAQMIGVAEDFVERSERESAQ